MVPLSRLAVGAIQAETCTEAIVLALLDWASAEGRRVQHFFSQARHHRLRVGLSAGGRNSQHLDSWVFSREHCRRALARSAKQCDLAIVDGCFQLEDRAAESSGGCLNELCWWLDLPRIAVLDVARLSACRLPTRPDVCDAVLLDRLPDKRSFCWWQTVIEALWGVPVIGGLVDEPELRDRLAQAPAGGIIAPALVARLGNNFGQLVNATALMKLASRRPLTGCIPHDEPQVRQTPLTVALAYDEAFCGYFPDALESLELAGADLIDFSPLHDEAPPPEADVVLLGDGRPEDFAAVLAENHCMLLGLRNHLCGGRRVYAEGGGLAYLSQQLEASDGTLWPMIGAIPALARQNHQARQQAEPIEIPLAGGCWLAPPGAQLRGYRTGGWQLEPTAALDAVASTSAAQPLIVAAREAVGSTVSLHFAASRPLVDSFFTPHRARRVAPTRLA